MPDMNGFDVLRRVRSRVLPFVVFVTVHEHYALQAFEAQAVDYLLKPIGLLPRATTSRSMSDRKNIWCGSSADSPIHDRAGIAHLGARDANTS